jgi:hypothetical protein
MAHGKCATWHNIFGNIINGDTQTVHEVFGTNTAFPLVLRHRGGIGLIRTWVRLLRVPNLRILDIDQVSAIATLDSAIGQFVFYKRDIMILNLPHVW